MDVVSGPPETTRQEAWLDALASVVQTKRIEFALLGVAASSAIFGAAWAPIERMMIS
jgi:hypothetical protein